MTIAAGFICRDGIIVCADTEITYGDALKSTGSKIEMLLADETIVTMTGAGHRSYIRMAWDKFVRRFETYKKKTLAWADFIEIVESTIGEIYKKHVPLYPADQKPWFSLIFAVKTRDGHLHLLISDETAVFESHTFEIAGVGATFGRFLADLLHWSPVDVSLRDGSIWAAYILWIAKKYTPGCGGDSSIFTITASGNGFYLGQVAALEERFAKWDSLVRPLFASAVDTRLSKDDFGARLQVFSEQIQQLREEWQSIPILEPELLTITRIQ